MTKELIKSVLKAKLSLLDYSIELLPYIAQNQINDFKDQFIKALNEVTGEYVKDAPDKVTEKKVKSISIE